MNVRLDHSKTAWLTALCALFLLINLVEWTLPVTVETVAGPVNPELNRAREEPAAYLHPSRGHFAAILERPVFFQDRKMPVEIKAAPPAPARPLRMKLEGIAIVADSKIAVLRSLADSQLLQLAEGAVHDGWELEAISADSATFRHGERVTRLSLDPAGTRDR